MIFELGVFKYKDEVERTFYLFNTIFVVSFFHPLMLLFHIMIHEFLQGGGPWAQAPPVIRPCSGYPNLIKIVAYQNKPRFVYAVKILSRYFTTESSLAHFCATQSGFIYAELQFIGMQKKIKFKPPGIDPVSYTLLYEQ